MAKVLYMQLPGDLSRLYIVVLALATVYTLIKIGVAVYKMYAFRKALVKTKSQSSKNIDEVCNALGLHNKVTLLDQTKPLAFCLGVLNPKIYISTGLVEMMNSEELKVIMKHEKYHLDNRDSLVFMVATIIESLFPFFPIISDFVRVYRMDREIQADAMAIRNTEDKHSLTEVLKKLLRYEPTTRPAFVASIISEDTLEARIHSLLFRKTAHRKVGIRNVIFSLVSLIILIGLTVSPVNAIELHDEGRDVVLLCDETLLQLQSRVPRQTPANFSFQN
ncbi:MAG: M56 family metallopeptidase [Patescibacteria group bacterium]